MDEDSGDEDPLYDIAGTLILISYIWNDCGIMILLIEKPAKSWKLNLIKATNINPGLLQISS